jgi:4-amino-4-deoxy-L-arabinose transferase-like glycosyltransferase
MVRPEPQVPGWRESLQSGWRIALLCALLSLAVRLPLAVHSSHQALTGDMLVYDLTAKSLASGHGYRFFGELASDKAPGYPFFVSLFYGTFGPRLLPVLVAQSFLAALACAAMVIFALRVTRRPAVALLTGLALAVHLPIAYVDTKLLSESLFYVSILAVVFTAESAIRTRKLWLFVLTGVLMGLSAYVRPNALFFPVLVFAAALYWRIPFRRSVLSTALVFAAAIVVVCPWALRNQRAFGTFTPMPSEGGVTLYGNWNAFVKPDYGLKLPTVPKSDREAVKGKKHYEIDRAFWRLGAQKIRQNPGIYAESILIRTIRQWTNLLWPDPPSKSSIAYAVSQFVLLALAIPGFWSRRVDPLFKALTVASVLYVTAVAALMSSGEVRFTFWVLPFLFILAADKLWGRKGLEKPVDGAARAQ